MGSGQACNRLYYFTNYPHHRSNSCQCKRNPFKNTSEAPPGIHINQQNIYNYPSTIPQSFHQIPTPPQDFTGREEEPNTLCQAAQNKGVVLSGVRGMGGVGKTALALMLTQRLAPD